MKNEITYEWVVEQCDQYGDIEPNHSDKLSNLAVGPREHPQGWVQVALTRIVGNDLDGMISRQYAYIDRETGQLPERFEDGQKIPPMYHRQVATAPFKIDHPSDAELETSASLLEALQKEWAASEA